MFRSADTELGDGELRALAAGKRRVLELARHFQHTVLSCLLTGNQQTARCQSGRCAAMRMVIPRPELAAPFLGTLSLTPRVPPLNLQPLSPRTLSHTR